MLEVDVQARNWELEFATSNTSCLDGLEFRNGIALQYQVTNQVFTAPLTLDGQYRPLPLGIMWNAFFQSCGICLTKKKSP
jgi:hypothetical protein